MTNPITIHINKKPLSVNKVWRGKKFKTKDYEIYESELLYTIPARKLPDPPYSISFEFGFSNINCDWDNPVKPLQDILQKKFGFNDRDIYEAYVKKVKVSKGNEYSKVEIRTLTE